MHTPAVAYHLEIFSEFLSQGGIPERLGRGARRKAYNYIRLVKFPPKSVTHNSKIASCRDCYIQVNYMTVI